MIPFPNKKYNIIYADPPWNVLRGCDYNSNGKSKPLPYPTMDLEEIKNLPIKDISKDNCKLFIWTINKYLPHVFDVIKRWGFNYLTTLIWNKKPRGIGLGGTFTTNAEYLIFACKGKQNAKIKYDRCWWELPRSYHSKKPDFFRNLIAETYDAKEEKIELFARQKTDGWDSWGNEVNMCK
jgi:site-specific DNA-methyltransferase (adenine-specific)